MDYEEYLDNTIRYVKKNEDPYNCVLDDYCSGINLLDTPLPVYNEKDNKK